MSSDGGYGTLKLSGNPLSIRILAAFHANTLLKNNDLKSIYMKVKNEMSLLDDDDRSYKSHKSRKGGNEVVVNSMSLRLSTEASVQLLRETKPQSYKLFYLLGCLPEGIKREHLTKIWPHEIDIDEGLEAFE